MKLINAVTIFAIVIPYTINLKMRTTTDYKINNFEKSLYEILIEKYNHTMFFSPRAIRISLGLLYLATKDRTAMELSKGLDMGIDNKQTTMKMFRELDADFRRLPIKFLTRLFILPRYKMKGDFNTLARKYFQSAIAEQVTFTEESEKNINNRIIGNTSELLYETLKKGKLSGRMILLSAVYLDCTLQNFKSSYAKFYDDRPHMTIMMHGKGYFNYGEIRGLVKAAVEIPINDLGHTLLVMLPYRGESVLAVEKRLRNLNIAKITAENLKKTWINVTLPEYTGTIDLTLDEEISKLELQRLQHPVGSFHNLVEFDSCPYLTGFISQTALFLRSGTRTARTAVRRKDATIKQLIFNRPFIYMVKSTSTIYFKGFITWLHDLDKNFKFV